MKPKESTIRFGALVRWAAIAFFVAQFVGQFPGFVTLVSPLIQNSSWSYYQKMQFRWDGYYELADFVLQHTPEDAVVLLGPKWTPNIDAYFLYPRKLYYGDETTLKQHPEIGFIAIDGDYPGFAVDGERVMLDGQRGMYRLRR